MTTTNDAPAENSEVYPSDQYFVGGSTGWPDPDYSEWESEDWDAIKAQQKRERIKTILWFIMAIWALELLRVWIQTQ